MKYPQVKLLYELILVLEYKSPILSELIVGNQSKHGDTKLSIISEPIKIPELVL